MTERERFISLYRAQVRQTLDFVTPIQPEDYDRVPIDNEHMFMGKRINRIHVSSILRHLIVAEQHWFTSLAEVRQGGSIPLPSNAAAVRDLPDAELADTLLSVSEAGIARVQDFTPARLATHFTFYGLPFTVMGFLWMLYGHQGFHKGQLDLLMRQLDYSPGEYLDYRVMPSQLLG